MPGLFSLLVEPVLFVLADRYPRKWFVCGGLLAMAAAAVAAAAATSVPVLAGAVAVSWSASGCGVALSLALPWLLGWIADHAGLSRPSRC